VTIVVATLAFTLGTLALASVAIGWWLGRTPPAAGRHRAPRTAPRTPAPTWADPGPEPHATYTEVRPVDDSETTVSIPMAALLSDDTTPLHTVTPGVK
jgi:hypothetical protein